jgi:hypothetical protein
MTVIPEAFSKPQVLTWPDIGPSHLELQTWGEFAVPSGVLEIGDAAAEEFVHEHSATVETPTGAASLELAVVQWANSPVASRVAALTLWFMAPLPHVDWIRHPQDSGMDSGVGLLVDAAETDEVISMLGPQEVWTPLMSGVREYGIARIGPALLFDGGPGLGDLPVWVARNDAGEFVGVRISTRLLDDSLSLDRA